MAACSAGSSRHSSNLSYSGDIFSFMSKPPPAPFYCPNCKSQVELSALRRLRRPFPIENIPCKNCRAALPAREGAFVLKYFLVHRTKTTRG